VPIRWYRAVGLGRYGRAREQPEWYPRLVIEGRIRVASPRMLIAWR